MTKEYKVGETISLGSGQGSELNVTVKAVPENYYLCEIPYETLYLVYKTGAIYVLDCNRLALKIVPPKEYFYMAYWVYDDGRKASQTYNERWKAENHLKALAKDTVVHVGIIDLELQEDKSLKLIP